MTFSFSGIDLPLDSGSEDELPGSKESCKNASVREAAPSRFCAVDPAKLANVMTGGKRRSKDRDLSGQCL